MIYINGVKASKADRERLRADIRNGKNRIKSKRKTKKGATAITTEF